MRMTLRRGDVVLAFYPFASGVGAKKRPVLVVQNDRENRRLDNAIVAQITTNAKHAHQPTHLLIEVTSGAGKQSGLLADSVISCVNLAEKIEKGNRQERFRPFRACPLGEGIAPRRP